MYPDGVVPAIASVHHRLSFLWATRDLAAGSEGGDRHAPEPRRRKAQDVSTERKCASGLCPYESIPRQLLQQWGDDIAPCSKSRHKRAAVLCHAWG